MPGQSSLSGTFCIDLGHVATCHDHVLLLCAQAGVEEVAQGVA